MKLIINVCSDSIIDLIVNGKRKRCYSNRNYLFDNLPTHIEVYVKQIRIKHKWYLALIYLLEGFFTLALSGYSEYSALEHIRPILYESCFLVTAGNHSTICVNSVSSSIDKDGVFKDGFIKIEGPDIINVKNDLIINEGDYFSAFIKTCFTFFSGLILLLLLFLFLILKSSFKPIGIVFCILVFTFLSIICTKKIYKEREKIENIRKTMRKTGEERQHNTGDHNI